MFYCFLLPTVSCMSPSSSIDPDTFPLVCLQGNMRESTDGNVIDFLIVRKDMSANLIRCKFLTL